MNLSISWVVITSGDFGSAYSLFEEIGTFILSLLSLFYLFSQILSKTIPTIMWLSPIQITVPDYKIVGSSILIKVPEPSPIS